MHRVLFIVFGSVLYVIVFAMTINRMLIPSARGGITNHPIRPLIINDISIFFALGEGEADRSIGARRAEPGGRLDGPEREAEPPVKRVHEQRRKRSQRVSGKRRPERSTIPLWPGLMRKKAASAVKDNLGSRRFLRVLGKMASLPCDVQKAPGGIPTVAM